MSRPGDRADGLRAPLPIAPGVLLPRLGLGVWQVADGEAGARVIGAALATGYRHVDTAQSYGNERAVGFAIRASGIPRDEIFVTTKFQTRRADPEAELEASLARLGLDRVDLYLVHDPHGGPTRAWPAMERVQRRGLARAVGVSNFTASELDALLAIATVPPAVNQIQLSPFAYRRALVDACRARGVAVEAYSPLTRARDIGNATVARVAQRVGRTPAQVMLRWGIEHGFAVLPKSNDPARQRENAQIFDFALGERDLAELDALDRTNGSGRAHESPWW